MRQIVLASGSPRRHELLKYIVTEFEIMASDIEEIADGSPREQVVKLARDKAGDIAAKRPGAVVIGADTLVAIGDTILGKPKNKADAARMLRALSGNTHCVHTGIAVISGGKTETRCVGTDVTFNEMSDEEIEEYIDTDEPMDKAGAYGIQGYGGKFIDRIDGCYFNVMGLPQSVLYDMIRKYL
ncbi:MAG: septum formation inhibitor Maf [Clostridia bacterium]|jgi:septum formation protein|nr:septum formation inhibitor Maf [Clostridia bacterium]MBT7121377.1 septum formation inhibitor Maf [Clostridia bacterium]